MNQGQSTWPFCFAPDDARSSLLRRASHGASQEPHTSIGPAQEIDLVAGEIEASQKQLSDGVHPVERKSDAQVLIGEQLVDDHSNTGS
jgi:hypothetical protein